MGRLPQSRADEITAARRIRDAPRTARTAARPCPAALISLRRPELPAPSFPVKHFTFACGRSIIEASSKE